MLERSPKINSKREKMNELTEAIRAELKSNGNKISFPFIENLAKSAKVTHVQITPKTRVCALTLDTGHEVVGYARVLFAENDVEAIGQEVAFNNARDELWSMCGSIALSL